MDKVWKPFKRQEDFLSLPDTIKEALYGGAAGGGKSECLLMLPIVRQFYKHPRFKGLLLRRTYPELEKEIILRSREWYPATGASYNDEKKRWTFPSGAIMQFGHMEYEQDARKYDTAEYNYVGFDELTSFTEFQYVYVGMTRCRAPQGSQLPAIVRAGTNPGNIGHSWVRARFVEPAPQGTIVIDKKTGLKRIFIQSLLKDNPYMAEDYARQLQSLPEAERRAKLDGDWYTFAGQVFDDWREVHIPDEPENALHVCEPFNIPDWWPRFLAIDWGFSAMTVALWGAISPEDRLYVYREYSGKQQRISSWASEVGKLSDGENLSDIVLCQSAWQDRGEDLTIAEQFRKYSGLTPRRADNQRVSGKLLMQEFLRWREKPKRKIPESGLDMAEAEKILRIQGLDAYKKYLETFDDEMSEANLPKLQVFPDCKQLRKCIPLCIYDDNNKEDVKEFDGDDPYDCARYLVKAADAHMGRGNQEAEYRGRVAAVLSDFNANHDYTALHRRMERLEVLRPKVQPIRRSHGASRFA